MPDNPAKARFLTTEEKVHVIRRLRVNGGAIETKVFKKHQYIEALKDPKSWLFVLDIFLNQVGLPTRVKLSRLLICTRWSRSRTSV